MGGFLAALLIGGGVAIGMFMPQPFSLGGWLTGAALIAFALLGRAVAGRDERTS